MARPTALFLTACKSELHLDLDSSSRVADIAPHIFTTYGTLDALRKRDKHLSGRTPTSIDGIEIFVKGGQTKSMSGGGYLHFVKSGLGIEGQQLRLIAQRTSAMLLAPTTGQGEL